ncbi:MAG: M28 family peptidase [Chloroflexota bacterium]|nr:M28 family peptidase [Chloroflexota bacterium]
MTDHARTLKRFLNGKPDFSNLQLPPRPEDEDPGTRIAHSRPRVSARNLVMNLPLMVGMVIVVFLFFITLFGPLFAPENPYLVGTTSLTMVEGKLQSPPFPPSPQQPMGSDQWGRDILSLLLYGTRNTMVAATFITMARVLLGTILGILAGWNEGESMDRFIMGTVGVTTALPLLLTGMILIFALDIRKGIIVFLIALCVVGWGEIAQYIRGEFLVLRNRPFIEGARAMGLTGSAIAVRHVLPNILPALIVISLLEMGATLMLLGELGFVSVFMGGGTQQENIFQVSATIPDIPEWGAMMADSRVWARGRPWMVLYPAMAFFLAVLGFNAMGEGLRRLIEHAGVNTAMLLSKRMLVVVVMVVAATWYIINNVGPAPSYARLAQTFDGQAALATASDILELADPAGPTESSEGRRAGSAGHDAVADYIAARFEAYGMQPAGGGRSYFQKIETDLVKPLGTPQLRLVDPSGQLVQNFDHQIDFGVRIDDHAGSGEAQAPITAIAFGRRRWDNESYRGMDLRDRIVLALGHNMPDGFTTEALIRGAQAVILVEEDPLKLRSTFHLADVEKDYLRQPTLPVLALSPDAADRLLKAGGSSLEALEEQVADLRDSGGSAWLEAPLPVQAEIKVELTEPERVTINNVLGYYPGQDVALNQQLVVINTHYDSPGIEPDGSVRYDGANDSASGIGILMEIARLWHEQDYTPRRTVLFAVLTGSELTKSGAEYYVESYGGPVGPLNPVAGFNLTRLGAGGDALEISQRPERVADLVERTASDLGVDVRRGDPLHHDYQQVLRREIPNIVIQRIDSEIDIRRDTIDLLSAEMLQEAGAAINLALIVVSRDASW